jgi:membrane associated rhomboid family serine protease
MLSDRNYMNGGGRRQPQYVNRENPNMCVYVLIAINAIVFLSVPNNLDLFYQLALSPIGIKAGMYWQIVTSMFMHGGFFHILFNMWGLYLFGTLITPHLKTARFLTMYFISGICGSLLWLLFNWNTPAVVVGASGALFGVLIVTAMLEPNREFIMLFFPFPMKTKTLVAVYAVVEIISAPNSIGNVAHLAHIGGLIGGYLYIELFCRKMIIWEPLAFLFPGKRFGGQRSNEGWTIKTAPLKFKTKDFDFDEKDVSSPVSQKELDYLLDKVSRTGINSLSESEMATLRRAREQMRKR